MKFLSRSVLVASIVAAGLFAPVGPGIAYSGCALSPGGGSGMARLGDGPSGFWAASSNSSTLGSLGAIALWGGSSIIAALLSGGTLLLRQRWQAQAAAALDAEVDLSLITETETVLVSEPAEIESEVALAYRR